MEVRRVEAGQSLALRPELASPYVLVNSEVRSQAGKNQDTRNQLEDLPIDPVISKEKLQKAVQSINDLLQLSKSHLKFEFHEKLEKYYIQIIDDRTNEVIREIPPKKILDMAAAILEQVGLIIDKKI